MQSTPLEDYKICLFGSEADKLVPIIQSHKNLALTRADPDLVVCYGSDGTLIAAELRWPGVPKVPILNSRLGHRCIPRPPRKVIAAVARGEMIWTRYTKLECEVFASKHRREPDFVLTCLNEVNVHMGRINSAVRFKLWIHSIPFENGVEMISDGFVACTAFGSNAYFKAITKGIFTRGIGLAFKATTHPINHLILPEEDDVRFQITRGPVTLAFDNSPDYFSLDAGDTLTVRKHPQSATILTCEPVIALDEPF